MVDTKHDHHGVDPHGHAGEGGDPGLFQKIEQSIGGAADTQDNGKMQRNGLNGGGHEGLAAHRGMAAGIGYIALGHLGRDIAGLFEDGGLALGGCNVDENDAQQHTADDADGGGGDRYTLCSGPVIQAQALQDLAHSAGSAVTAAEALAQLIAEGAVEVGVTGAAKEQVGSKANGGLHEAQCSKQRESLENIGGCLFAAAALLGRAVHEHSQGNCCKDGHDQGAGQQ